MARIGDEARELSVRDRVLVNPEAVYGDPMYRALLRIEAFVAHVRTCRRRSTPSPADAHLLIIAEFREGQAEAGWRQRWSAAVTLSMAGARSRGCDSYQAT